MFQLNDNVLIDNVLMLRHCASHSVLEKIENFVCGLSALFILWNKDKREVQSEK